MRKKLYLIYILMLATLFLFNILGVIANGEGIEEVNIIINNGGSYQNANNQRIKWAVENYTWWVGNKEYKINTYNKNFTHFNYYCSQQLLLDTYFNSDNYQVHIIDGEVDENLFATIPIVGDLIKNVFRQYLINDGAFIGKCGSSFFPPYFDGFPDTIVELDYIERTGFLGNTPKVCRDSYIDPTLYSD